MISMRFQGVGCGFERRQLRISNRIEIQKKPLFFNNRKTKISLPRSKQFKGGTAILGWLRDLLEIYTWWELWLVVSIPSAMVGVWFLLSFLIGIQNDVIRTVAIWSLLFVLTLGAATVDAIRRRRGQ